MRFWPSARRRPDFGTAVRIFGGEPLQNQGGSVPWRPGGVTARHDPAMGIEVTGAALDDGLLRIDLERPLVTSQVRRIAIASGSGRD